MLLTPQPEPYRKCCFLVIFTNHGRVCQQKARCGGGSGPVVLLCYRGILAHQRVYVLCLDLGNDDGSHRSCEREATYRNDFTLQPAGVQGAP